MGLFGKNPNEVLYAGGKKHYIDVIKNRGDGNLLMWLNPEEDFNTGSVLVVGEAEEACFWKDGVIVETFTGGRYPLETENYPFLSRLRNSISGGISTFNCKIYFVRKADSREIRWGTDTPIQVRDPVLGIPVGVQARGAFKVRIKDAKRFVVNMVGNNVFYFTQDDIVDFCRSQMRGKIKSTIARELSKSNEEIIGVAARQDEFSEQIAPYVAEMLEEYGIGLVSFSIESLDVPMDDPYRVQRETILLDATRTREVGHAQNQVAADEIDQRTGADARAFVTLGSNWQRQQAADILHSMASNEGGGGDLAGLGAGLGAGLASARAFGSLADDVFVDGGSGSTGDAFCTECGAKLPVGAKFCAECGSPVSKKVCCKRCGTPVEPGMKFCPSCGVKLSD